MAAMLSGLLPLLALSSGPLAPLYGLIRVHQMPSLPALVSVDPGTGKLTLVDRSGAGLPTTAGTGDLVAIDRSAGRYYYLGDTNMSRLVALSLADGKEVCATAVPQLDELQCVGCGQSLSLDPRGNGSLLMSGIGANASAGNSYHQLLRAPLPSPRTTSSSLCPSALSVGGRFGDADYMPVAHASEYDATSQRLFVTLSTGARSYGIGVVDTSVGQLTKVLPEATGSQLVGLTWVAVARRLVGVAQDSEAISFRTLDPETGQWTNAPLTIMEGLNFTLATLYGNQGAVRAFDPSTGILFCLIAGHPPDGADGSGGGAYGSGGTERRRAAETGGLHLAHVDVATGMVVGVAPLHGDKGISSEVLLQLAA